MIFGASTTPTVSSCILKIKFVLKKLCCSFSIKNNIISISATLKAHGELADSKNFQIGSDLNVFWM
jgi:hypothetical protein